MAAKATQAHDAATWKLLTKKRGKDKDGNQIWIPECTSENFLTIFRNDPHFGEIRFNVMRGQPDRPDKENPDKRVLWSDSDDAEARVFIETHYGLAHRAKTEDAFRVFLQDRVYNPVLSRIERLTWDGRPRCETFLIDRMGADDTAYSRECSRLIFSGGINRIANPGCRFDCVIVLRDNQGSGKSTFCQYLALDADFYSSTKTISGQKGLEAISGKWVCELEELLAVIANDHAGQKVEEAAKAFLSTASDYYRRPYDRRPLDVPRYNIFVGTTNRPTFLTDRTGNRRWFPVHCNSDPAWFYEHREEAVHELEQAWAEMFAAYKAGSPLASPTPNPKLLSEIREQQTDAEVEDPRKGQIEAFLDGKEKTCIAQVWRDCLYKDYSSPPVIKRADSLELGEILVNQLGWVRGGVERFGLLGSQKAYLRPK